MYGRDSPNADPQRVLQVYIRDGFEACESI